MVAGRGDVIFEMVAVVALVFGFYVRTIPLLLLVILLPALELWIPNGLWAFHGGDEFPVMWILMQPSLCLLGAGSLRCQRDPPLLEMSWLK